MKININKYLLAASCLIFILGCSSAPPPVFSEEEWLAKTQAVDISLLYAPNLAEDGSFYNPWLERERSQISGAWRLRGREKFETPSDELYGSVPNNYSYLTDENFDSISYAGHASFIIKMGGQTIFTDPFFSSAAFIARKKVIIKFDYSHVPERPVVLISHNHYDHLDRETVKELARKGAVFIVPLRVGQLIVRYGGREVHELDWWQSITINSIEYTLLPAQHWSRRLGHAGGSSLWGSFMIQGQVNGEIKTIYFSGDSGYFAGFREYGNLWNVDYAIFGAGAYEPRWFMHYSHMNVEEFFRAYLDIGARFAIPMHFGIMRLSDEPLLYPLYEIDVAIRQNPELGKMIRPLRVGEYLEIE